MSAKTAYATITYQSGRTENFTGKVNKDGTAHKLFDKRVNEFKAFPTVTKVDVVIQ